MIKSYLKVFVLLLLPIGAGAQSLSVTARGNTSANSVSTLSLAEGQVSFNSGQAQFRSSGSVVSNFLDYGIAPDLSVVGFVSGGGGESNALLVDSRGDTLSRFKVTALTPSDPSVAAYPSNTGELLVRDNIASFSFYDSFGEIVTQVSSSSQSEGGEAISEVAMDPHAQTIVVYNPKIKREGQLGSQAQVVNASNKLESIYFNTRRTIKDARVSDDGQFIVLLTSSGGSDDEVIIMDRFGNKLNAITSDENLIGANLTGDGSYITLYAEGRVLVYNTLSGKREGSASLRSPVIMADYFPEDQIVLGMTGNYSSASGIVNNVTFHAIHLGQRKIARQSFGSAIGINEAVEPQLVRSSANRYELKGVSQQLQIQAAF